MQVDPMTQAIARTTVDPAKLDAAAKDFEAVFASQMLSHMFTDLDVDPWFGGGQAEEVYRSLLVDEYGKQVAERGGLGIADSIRKQFLSLQEVGQ